MGIAPTLRPWEGRVLLLHHARIFVGWNPALELDIVGPRTAELCTADRTSHGSVSMNFACEDKDLSTPKTREEEKGFTRLPKVPSPGKKARVP
jgi:hypothetical protein